MTTKTTGSEFKAFYSDPVFWPDGAWHEDQEITVDGTSEPKDGWDYTAIPDSSVVAISGGAVMDLPGREHSCPSMEGHFRAWKKKQTMVSFLVECDKDQFETVKAAIKSAGGKVK